MEMQFADIELRLGKTSNMYTSENFSQQNNDTFVLEIPEDRDLKLLQLTDLHLGFGIFSHKKDKQAIEAVTTLIKRTKPDLIILTGDSIYPFWPQAGTANNRKEAEKFLVFMDGFEIPYALIMGNHDTELGSKLDRKQLGEVFKTGKYAIFTEGPDDIYGVGNYMIEVRGSGISKNGETLGSEEAFRNGGFFRDGEAFRNAGTLRNVLCFLDSNMYVTKLFFSGFDRIHSDQTKWCMDKLEAYKKENANLEAMAFYHMPVAEFKQGYEKMKLGDKSVVYNFGTVSEEEDYFGISPLPGDFFEKALENGVIKYMFCGHDHLNNISLTYKGITMTYGMSIDCLGYRGIDKKEIQRGATQITLFSDNKVKIEPVPLTNFVTARVRGAEKINKS